VSVEFGHFEKEKKTWQVFAYNIAKLFFAFAKIRHDSFKVFPLQLFTLLARGFAFYV